MWSHVHRAYSRNIKAASWFFHKRVLNCDFLCQVWLSLWRQGQNRCCRAHMVKMCPQVMVALSPILSFIAWLLMALTLQRSVTSRRLLLIFWLFHFYRSVLCFTELELLCCETLTTSCYFFVESSHFIWSFRFGKRKNPNWFQVS